jgi:group I intron endonuclease
MDKISGIYVIRSLSNPSKLYIGSSVDIHRRWRAHKSNLSRNLHKNQKLQNHYNKYGDSDLEYYVYIECDKDILLSEEQRIINEIKPQFNIVTDVISRGTRGLHHTQEAKDKIGAAGKGRMGYWAGKHQSPELIEKRTSKIRGRKLSDDHIKQISERMLGNKHNLGKHHSEAAKTKMRENNYQVKIVVNIETGIFYIGTVAAAASMGINADVLRAKLNGRYKNNTMFRYV